jgi:hypothetical protein
MKKIIIIMILVLVFVFFGGCGYFEVTCSIDDKNTAEMKIAINIQRDGLSFEERGSVRSQLDDLIIYWRNALGYDVAEDFSDDDLYDITLCKKVECESKQEALYELLEMMGSESSPFLDVQGGYTSSYLSDYYNVRAEVDLSEIVDHSFIDRLPQAERNYVLENLEGFSGRVKFTLNGKTIENTGSLAGQTTSADLCLDSTTKIYSLVEVPNTDHIFEYDLLKNEVSELAKTKSLYLILLLAAAGAVLVLAAVIIVMAVMRRGRSTAEGKSALGGTEPDNPDEDKNRK